MPLFAALASLTTVGGVRLHAGFVGEIKVGNAATSQSITVTNRRMPDDYAPALDPLLSEPMPPVPDIPPLPPLPGSKPTNFVPRMTLAGSPCSTRIGGRGITNRRGQCVLESSPCVIGKCEPGTDCQMKPIAGRYNRRGVCVQEGASCHYGCDERNLPPGAVCIPGPGEWDRNGKCVPARFQDNRLPGQSAWTAPDTWLERYGGAGPFPMGPMPMGMMPPMPFSPPGMMPPMPGAGGMPGGDGGDYGDEPPASAGGSSDDSTPFINMGN